ncbi:polysaccharide biosynthesis C-terminal domain-containing protein [Desulfohalovibrio reitneri]|uniref:polysaccharide biosynthesis C-terminal domain-containing protein n=1 Tax=Desulfohalovibrio reitneri TaxID=1307759 RepID=UPI0004A6D378|nr:polysaccharide biosynthesis C-terminal domain-containing protein [Desulfohalovibrio reitneri]
MRPAAAVDPLRLAGLAGFLLAFGAMTYVATQMGVVARYTGPFQIADNLMVLPSTLSATLFPAVSSLRGGRDRASLHALTASALKGLGRCIGLIVIGLTAAGNEVVLVFLGTDYLGAPVDVFRLLCLGFLINALAFVPYSIVQGVGRPDLVAKCHVAELPLHLGALALVAPWLSIHGVALAWVLRVGLDAGLLFYFSRRLEGFSFRETARLGGRRTGLLLGAGLACAWALSSWPDIGAAARVALAAALVLACAAAALAWCLTPDERG